MAAVIVLREEDRLTLKDAAGRVAAVLPSDVNGDTVEGWFEEAERWYRLDDPGYFPALVEKARTNTLGADDLVGANISLTNPGGIGTISSVPRLMNGQGTIVATGSIAYPVGLGNVGAAIGAEKVMTMTSTYDHRVIQGAESGQFLKVVEAFLQGEHNFYEQVFEVPVIYEDESSAAFQFENTIVNLLKLPAARELIEPGAVADREAGSRFQLTIWVDDADAVSAELATHGVELLNGPMNREWGVRTASFTDPDGHIWEIAQKLSGS